MYRIASTAILWHRILLSQLYCIDIQVNYYGVFGILKMVSAFVSVLGVSKVPICCPLKGIKFGARNMYLRVFSNNIYEGIECSISYIFAIKSKRLNFCDQEKCFSFTLKALFVLLVLEF